MKELIPQERIEQKIFLVRGQKVMVDRDLSELYGVETKYLNRQVRRNRQRFPSEFMFRLTKSETNELVTICHRFKNIKHSSSMPCVFTEHGALMLASVLKSERAIKISISIVKAFVKLREVISVHKDLAYKLVEMERKIENHDLQIRDVFKAIRQLMAEPASRKVIRGFAQK